MPQEVRSILFSAEEVTLAVIELLVRENRRLEPNQIMAVEVQSDEVGAVHAIVRFRRASDSPRVIAADQLMSAILSFCSKSRIPLATKAHKRLERIGTSVALTSSLGLRARPPTVQDGAVVHAAPPPALAKPNRW